MQNFVTVLRIVDLQGTDLSGHILRNFLRNLHHGELYRGIVYEQFLFSAIFHFWTLYFTTLRTVFVRTSRTTNHATSSSFKKVDLTATSNWTLGRFCILVVKCTTDFFLVVLVLLLRCYSNRLYGISLYFFMQLFLWPLAWFLLCK